MAVVPDRCHMYEQKLVTLKTNRQIVLEALQQVINYMYIYMYIYIIFKAYFFYLVGLHYMPHFDYGHSKKPQKSAKLSVTLHNIITWQKSHWISEAKNILTEEQTNGTFWGQLPFLFFPPSLQFEIP